MQSPSSVQTGSERATLLVGKTDNDQTYVKDASRPAIMALAPSIVTDLSKNVADFRRKDLFDMRSFTVRRVELKRGTETSVFEKTGTKDGKDTWKNGAGKDVDATVVYGVNHKVLKSTMTVISTALSVSGDPCMALALACGRRISKGGQRRR